MPRRPGIEGLREPLKGPLGTAQVLDLLCAQAREQGAGCLIVTHAQDAAQRADRVLRLRSDGVDARIPSD